MIQFKNYTYTYGNSNEAALQNISMRVHPGEFLLITGKSGCGKSTLAKGLNGLIPHFFSGNISGWVELNGQKTSELNLHQIGKMVGSIFQDPRSQFFTTNTTDEVAFGCQNMGLPRTDILQRVQSAFTCLGIENLQNKSIFKISSGEKQKVAIASCCAMGPSIFLFDEPSANLDLESTFHLASLLGELKQSGRTIIVFEHRLFYLSGLYDRVIHMQEGRIARELTPEQAESLTPTELQQMGLRHFHFKAPVPSPPHYPRNSFLDQPASLEIQNLSFSYHRRRFGWQPSSGAVLTGVTLKAHPGEVVGLIGENGAGKTTFSRVCCGLLRESTGRIFVNGKARSARQRLGEIYFVVQDSDYQLFSDSVLSELKIGAGTPPSDEECQRILSALYLWRLRDAHPASLSRGQKQRLTIATALASDAEILFFDEPSSGLDGDSLRSVAALFGLLQQRGKTVFVVSHDYELLISACSRIIKLHQGGVQHDFYLNAGNAASLWELMASGNGEAL